MDLLSKKILAALAPLLGVRPGQIAAFRMTFTMPDGDGLDMAGNYIHGMDSRYDGEQREAMNGLLDRTYSRATAETAEFKKVWP